MTRSLTGPHVILFLTVKPGQIYTYKVSKCGGVIPETFVRVQTGHKGLTLKVPSLVSLLWVLATSRFCSSPGSNSAQGSDVSLTVPKGETPGAASRLGEELGQRGHTGWRLEWDM